MGGGVIKAADDRKRIEEEHPSSGYSNPGSKDVMRTRLPADLHESDCDFERF